MDISLYDKVRLKDGRIATIVEIYEPQRAYEADIEESGEYITDTITHDEISKIM